MKKISISAIAVAISFAFSAGAMAQVMSKDQYKSHKDGIAAESRAAKAACDSFSGNAKDVCMTEAKGKDRVAAADLEARYKPGQKNAYNARVARADAGYAVASEKCDDHAGNVKDVCLKEAKAAQTSAIADARSQMKTTDARNVAREKSVDARKDAAEEKRDADYAVARERCGSYSGDAKDSCIADAKARHGRT